MDSRRYSSEDDRKLCMWNVQELSTSSAFLEKNQLRLSKNLWQVAREGIENLGI